MEKNKIVMIRHRPGPTDDRAQLLCERLDVPVANAMPFTGDTAALDTDLDTVAGSIIHGGPYGIDRVEDHPFLAHEMTWIERCIAHNIPLLGICQGAQQIAHVLGGATGPRTDGYTEFGYYDITATPEGRDIFPDRLTVCQSHFHGHTLSQGMIRLSESPEFPNQAFRYGETTWGFQFHAEITPHGFRRWQDADWAMYDAPGAQPRAEQDRLQRTADPIMGDWFERTLARIFPILAPTA